MGSVTVRTAAAVTAASMALPPFWRTARPAVLASGWLVETMPWGALTTDRPARERGR